VLVLDATGVGDQALLNFKNGGLDRWYMYLEGGTESGANSGSGLAIARYDDAGVLIDQPIFITRSNAQVTFSGNLRVFRAAVPALLMLDVAGTGEARTQFKRSGVLRWEAGMAPDAESSGNVGASFNINAYADTGALLGTPFFIDRPTMQVSIGSGMTVGASLPAASTGQLRTHAIAAHQRAGNDAAGSDGYGCTNSAGTSSSYWYQTAGNSMVLENTHANGVFIKGTTNAATVSPGYVAEVFNSTVIPLASRVNLTTAVAANVVSFTLAAGDWDVWGIGQIFVGASGQTTYTFSISTASATLGPTEDQVSGGVTIATIFTALCYRRVNIATPTVFYLVAYANFGPWSVGAYGYMTARRVR
jgi:hypothetical protein